MACVVPRGDDRALGVGEDGYHGEGGARELRAVERRAQKHVRAEQQTAPGVAKRFKFVFKFSNFKHESILSLSYSTDEGANADTQGLGEFDTRDKGDPAFFSRNLETS